MAVKSAQKPGVLKRPSWAPGLSEVAACAATGMADFELSLFLLTLYEPFSLSPKRWLHPCEGYALVGDIDS